jgi:uncharacterized peroxidase-related enzyme
MRLTVVGSGHAPDEAAVLDQIRERTGREPLGVVKTLLYRPELFGLPFSQALDRVMRGPSVWSAGERELFAGFTSLLNQCPFWTNSHGAVASYALGEEVWQTVVADWRTAPLRPELAATLVFLEKLTLRPEELGPADADAVRAAGVSDEALRDATTVCALFSMIVRLADSFGWDVPEWDALTQRAPAMLEGGYALQAVGKR